MRLSFLHNEDFYVFTYEQCKLHFLFKSDGKTTGADIVQSYTVHRFNYFTSKWAVTENNSQEFHALIHKNHNRAIFSINTKRTFTIVQKTFSLKLHDTANENSYQHSSSASIRIYEQDVRYYYVMVLEYVALGWPATPRSPKYKIAINSCRYLSFYRITQFAFELPT